jgi:hypothetical protein
MPVYSLYRSDLSSLARKLISCLDSAVDYHARAVIKITLSSYERCVGERNEIALTAMSLSRRLIPMLIASSGDLPV